MRLHVYHLSLVTLGLAYNQFGYNEHPATIAINVKKCSVTACTTYNEQVFVNEVTPCKRDPV